MQTNSNRKPQTEKEIATLLLLGIFLLTTWLRLLPAATAGFPINDGGMFYTMIADLRQNHYALPSFTTYNNLNIPYTYPPLPFYLAGWLADTLRISDLTVLLWLPAVINILTVFAFTLLAAAVLKDPLKIAAAAFFYALTPLSMDWFLMGGGLTRGLGQLFLILTCWSTYQLFNKHSRRYLLPAIFSSALVLLCHPESALLALTSAAIIFICSRPDRRSFFDALFVGLAAGLLCAPWLAYVLRLHGAAPFFNALQTNGSALFMWSALLTFNFSQESGLAFMAVLGLIGLYLKLAHKEYLLPLWLAMPFFINPRSAARAAILPLALLAAWTLLDVILPALRPAPSSSTRPRSFAALLFLVYMILYQLFNAYTLGQNMALGHLDTADRQVFAWVQQNTPSSANFILITGQAQPMRDPLQEWFPALTGRRSQTTLQGREWIWGPKFIESLVDYQGLKDCLWQGLPCLEDQTRSMAIDFDHIYIKKQSAQTWLLADLRASGRYHLLYEDASAAIFAK